MGITLNGIHDINIYLSTYNHLIQFDESFYELW